MIHELLTLWDEYLNDDPHSFLVEEHYPTQPGYYSVDKRRFYDLADFMSWLRERGEE